MIALNLPINSVSFGQLSIGILRELFKREIPVLISPIGQIDLSSQFISPEFGKYLQESVNRFPFEHSRKNPIFRLWHLTPDTIASYSEKQTLLSFYELDSPTPLEKNVLENQNKTFFTSKYAIDVFAGSGVDPSKLEFLPLFFDETNFKVAEVKYPDDRVVFGLMGKWEKRKHHAKMVQAWVRKYGNKSEFFLNCAINNPHMDPQRLQAEVYQALGGKKYFNVNFLGSMKENALYNNYLNSNHIVLAMSGGEGWGLPEFQSVAMGKYCVGMPVNGYAEWMTEENTVTVQPCGKVAAYDNQFFKEGAPVNQGNIFDFDEEEFLTACDVAIEKHKAEKVNKVGLLLPSQFPVSTTVDKILKELQ